VVDSTNADPLPGDPINLNGVCVGYVTSASTGFRVGQCLALGYVSNNIDIAASEFKIDLLGEAQRATLASQIFYDPDNERLRS